MTPVPLALMEQVEKAEQAAGQVRVEQVELVAPMEEVVESYLLFGA